MNSTAKQLIDILQSAVQQSRDLLPIADYLASRTALNKLIASVEQNQQYFGAARKPFLTSAEVSHRRRLLYSKTNARDGLGYCPHCKRNFTEFRNNSGVVDTFHPHIRNSQCSHLPCVHCVGEMKLETCPS